MPCKKLAMYPAQYDAELNINILCDEQLNAWEVMVVPAILVFDSDGSIVEKHSGVDECIKFVTQK